MTAYPAWTPASRPGIVPLRPLTFGEILGRSFTALRQNPRVLLGFALVVQTIVTIVASLVIAAVGVWALTRVMSLRPMSEDYETVMAGSVAIAGIVTFVVALASSALAAIVQGIVVVEVTHEVVAEKLTLARLWRRVRPVVWRLIGYSAAVFAAIALLVGIVIGGLVLLSTAIGWMTLVVGIPLLLAALPVTYWLTVKLLLVPAIIVVEGGTILRSMARSWRLTRGRFWPSLGIVVIISFAFGLLAQVVSMPMSLLSMGIGQILSPTGDPDVGGVVSMLLVSIATQIVVVLIQSVSLVVLSTATSLIYVDCRMRREGLALDLLTYVEQRDAGHPGLPDPYLQHIGRIAVPPPPAGPYAPGHPPYPAGAHGPVPQAAYPPPYPSPYPPAAQATYPPPGPSATTPPRHDPVSAADVDEAPADAPASGAPESSSGPSSGTPPTPSSTQWTAPGSEQR